MDAVLSDITREEILSDHVVQPCLDHIYVPGKRLSEVHIIAKKLADHYFLAVKIEGLSYKREGIQQTTSFIDNGKVTKYIKEIQ